MSSAPAEASYHFRESTLKQRTSYRDEYSNDLGTGKKILISVGRQLAQTAQGVKQFGLEAGEKLGVVKKGAAAQYTAVVNEEKQVYDSTPVAKSIPGKVGQYGTEMLIVAALPASTGLKAAKLIAASAGTGAALGGVQVTEEGTLAARGKKAVEGAAIGAGGALVISKASAAIKAAASKIGAATKASKKPAAILNQYNLRPRTSSPNYVGGSTKSTARTSASKPGLPLTQYENVKIGNPHTTTNSSHNASNANAQIELKLNYDQFVRVHPLSGKRSATAVQQLEKSMRLNGFDSNKPIEAVIYNDKFYIVDGHHRYRAAKMAGINEIPVRIISDIKNHSSSWNTVEEVVKDASSCGMDHLKFKY